MTRSLRITYLHQYFTPPNAIGGTRSYEFARRLVKAGHTIHMITSSAYLPSEFQNRRERIFKTEFAGIPTIVINQPYASEMGFAARIWAFIGFAVRASRVAMQQPADVIFATSTPLTIAIPAIAGRMWQRIPMVFEVRDLWPELPIAVKAIRHPFLKWAARWLERTAYRNSNRIVALSPGMRDGVVKTGFPAQNVHVIPNCCDVDFFDVESGLGREFRQQFDWLADRPLVVYAGSLGMINGVGYLAQIAKAMASINSEVRFLVIGRGGHEEESVRALATQLGVLDKSFFMIPPIQKSQMPSALSATDVATSLFIDVPAMQHNSANKFFDALASGTPIAINYGGWQAKLLEENEAGIVLDPSDINLAAQELNKFLMDKARLQKAGANSRKLAKLSFDRDDMAVQLNDVIQAAYEEK